VSLAGRHAVVTGGTRGIGRAIALLLAKEGVRVSIVSRSGGVTRSAFHAQADVTDEEQVRRAFAACREANGPIEILVNNSGIAESAPLKRTDRPMWDRIIATNLTGTFLCTREAVPDMIAAGWGRIVNMASTAGLDGAPYLSAYCASKHGVVGFTRAVAAELDKNGITVNAICPGYTETEMMDRTIANITARTGKTERETRELLARSNPGGRIATAEEVALEVLELIEGAQTGAAIVIPRDGNT
jgi:NAD(P)-dependent dehydrogenase (short-subunit alcohol dehydrogenase family)